MVLNDVIPGDYLGDTTSGAVLDQVIPAWRTTLETSTISSMIELIFANKPFGLRYDIETRTWKIVFEVNLNQFDNFSLGKQGDNSNQQLDSSWLLLLTTDTEYYTVKSRLIRYIFESDKQIRFFFDASDKIYDAKNNTVVKDKIKVLNINTKPDALEPFTFDRDWEITEEYKGIDGYVDSKKIQVTFSDTDDDGIVDDPAIFEEIIAPDVSDKYVVLERYEVYQGQEDYRLFDNTSQTVLEYDSITAVTNISSFTNGQYFYFKDINSVRQLNIYTAEFAPTLAYKYYIGRDKIKFQYIHNADYESRIDPGMTNFIDVYVLTKQYDRLFRQWLLGSISEQPLPLSTDSLNNLLASDLNKIKSISDEIIYHPVTYRVLFGEKASSGVQASFKVVKNSEAVISDNDVKSRVLSAINEFFSLENWDFGYGFYFTELSSYVMNRLAPSIVNFIIVPRQGELTFGSLFEIKAEKDQVFINGATIDDIEIIQTITSSNIRSSGAIAASTSVLNNQNITSSRNV